MICTAGRPMIAVPSILGCRMMVRGRNYSDELTYNLATVQYSSSGGATDIWTEFGCVCQYFCGSPFHEPHAPDAEIKVRADHI